MLSFLTSAIGGSLLGTLLKQVSAWSEGLLEIKRTKVQAELQEKVASWEAFGKSQETHDTFSVPSGVWPWVASIVTLCLGLVEALRRFTRPGLTWGLLGFLWFTYSTADATASAAQVALLGDITFGAFTALFWWFGERYSVRKGAKAGR